MNQKRFGATESVTERSVGLAGGALVLPDRHDDTEGEAAAGVGARELINLGGRHPSRNPFLVAVIGGFLTRSVAQAPQGADAFADVGVGQTAGKGKPGDKHLDGRGEGDGGGSAGTGVSHGGE